MKLSKLIAKLQEASEAMEYGDDPDPDVGILCADGWLESIIEIEFDHGFDFLKEGRQVSQPHVTIKGSTLKTGTLKVKK